LKFLSGQKTVWQPDENVNVEQEVAYTLDSLGRLTVDKSVSVSVEPKGLRAEVEGSKFRQILRNLIRNALRALIGKENGALQIAACSTLDALDIRIQDNGKGMTPEQLADLFRGKPSDLLKKGIGFQIARQYVIEEAGGRLDVESSVDAGTLVTISIPVKTKDNNYDNSSL
jgi:signal transduction histidine kinase